MNDLDKYCDEFGEKRGLAYFRAGLSHQEATSKFNVELRKENDILRKQVKLNSQSEDEPLSGSGSDSTGTKGFSSKLKMPS